MDREEILNKETIVSSILKKKNSQYHEWFFKIKRFVSNTLFPSDQAELLFFLPHGLNHFYQVEKNLEKILKEEIWEFFSEDELFVLLCSVWLHDAGMSKEESRANTEIEIRRIHHHESARIIRDGKPFIEDIRKDNSFYEALRYSVAIAAEAHRRSINMEKVPEKFPFPNSKIRLRLIASLLRVADGIDLTNVRVDKALLHIYGQIGMPHENWIHWVKHMIRAAIYCDPDQRIIELNINLPKLSSEEKHEYDTAINFLIEELKKEIESELFSVATFIESENIQFFTKVVVNTISYEFSPKLKDDVLLAAQWSKMISAVNATKIEEIFLEAIKIKCEQSMHGTINKQSLIDEIKKLINEIIGPRQHHFGLKNLYYEFDEIIKKNKSPESIINWIEEKTKLNKGNQKKLVDRGIELIEEYDTLILFSYSSNVINIINNIPENKQRTITLIICESRVKDRIDYREGLRIIQECSKHQYKNVIYTLDNTLSSIIENNKKYKILIGADGYSQNSILNTSGTSNLANLCVGNDLVKLYVFVTTNREIKNLEENVIKEILNKRRNLDNYYALHSEKEIITHTNVEFLVPYIDFIPIEKINGGIVTENEIITHSNNVYTK